MSERVESMNAKSGMFQAAISNKFTERHVDNFHDTTLTAAKQRAEKKMEKQAEAIDKQQKKVETEVCQHIGSIYGTNEETRSDHIEAASTASARGQAPAQPPAFCRHARTERVSPQPGAMTRDQVHRCDPYSVSLARRHRARVHCVSESSASCRNGEPRGFGDYPELLRLRLQIGPRADAHRTGVRSNGDPERGAHAFAKKVVVQMEMQKFEERERNHAATVIQSNAKSFMTRLIYLDALYVICRIQAVMRGFLIRRRLQWVAAIDIDDDNDMSFLDIDFKIPESMQKGKKGGLKSVGGGKKPKRQLSKVKKASASSSSSVGGEGNQEEITTNGSRVSSSDNSSKTQTARLLKAEMVESDFEFDYGSEFEEIIDEAKLGRLIC